MSKNSERSGPTGGGTGLDELQESVARTTAAAEALQQKLLDQMQDQALTVKVGVLSTEIGILKRDIETLVVMATNRGAEPDVGSLRLRLAKKEAELSELIKKRQLKARTEKRSLIGRIRAWFGGGQDRESGSS